MDETSNKTPGAFLNVTTWRPFRASLKDEASNKTPGAFLNAIVGDLKEGKDNPPSKNWKE
ncbi:hypothetical protein PEC301645_36900 [Pectobacterium carotovorum subsp. carotovorum]|nr:hypothetical protein PEC301645_36900 [Pectobacterium carotovorum subsp. carotovorum]